MSQMTFSDYEYSLRKRKTKREEFLDIMNEMIPWEEWVEFVRPYYPNGKRGRPTKGIEKMLRMYLLQIWFNLSDEGVEDAIYDSYAFRKFMNIDFMKEQVPDTTTLLKFRHLLEENHLGEEFFKAINRVMEATGHIMHGGTIVDATIISAPSSTKNAEKKRDPEMHQTKKGNDPKSLSQVSDHAIDWERYIENRKSAVRCKVEHVFKIIKDTFGFRKVRYRGLAKNLHKLNVLFACANLLMVKRGQIKSQKLLARG